MLHLHVSLRRVTEYCDVTKRIKLEWSSGVIIETRCTGVLGVGAAKRTKIDAMFSCKAPPGKSVSSSKYK